MIRFDDVSVTYRGGVQALRGLALTIEDGEFVVIVGLSGAGKSTLLRALNGRVPATGGSITVDGAEGVGASATELRALRSQIGMIFQTFNLVNRTSVLNNVLMGRLGSVPAWRSTLGLWPADARARALQALERVGNLHYLDLAREFGNRLVGLRDGELVFDGDIADVDDDTFMEIYGRAISDDDLVGTEDDLT